jgi:hypothetical protein
MKPTLIQHSNAMDSIDAEVISTPDQDVVDFVVKTDLFRQLVDLIGERGAHSVLAAQTPDIPVEPPAEEL